MFGQCPDAPAKATLSAIFSARALFRRLRSMCTITIGEVSLSEVGRKVAGSQLQLYKGQLSESHWTMMYVLARLVFALYKLALGRLLQKAMESA